MQTRSRFALTLCGVAAACLCLVARAQSPGIATQSKQDPRVRVEADIVLVPVSVSDPAGRLVTGLGLGHFAEMEQRTTFAGAKGSTALLDGVYLAANQLRGASNRRKALVLISDGEDNHSRYSEKDVQQVLREADAQLYAIGGFGSIGYGILEKMVNMTGGRMFGGYAIEDTTSKIWAELRSQYVLVYRPSNRQRDGKWRKIEVRLKSLPRGMPKLYVNAKSGYLAPQ